MILPKTAMVMCAGFGKRMLPLTNTVPKPLIPVNGKPIVDYTIEQLRDFGVEKIIVNTHHLADKIKNHFSENADVIISDEKEILETGGGLINALPMIGSDPIFVINGDVIFNDKGRSYLDILYKSWNPSKMDVLFLLHKVSDAIGYDGAGNFNLSDDGELMQNDGYESHDYVYTGAMIINPDLLNGLKIEKLSIYRDIIRPKTICDDGVHKRVCGVVYDGQWLHIGTVDGVKEAEKAINC
ncbi:nucleotidyltransferase family protein [Rickettsiales bacterium]|nr:nucleotidyltransferase family protein [Rickettsiales bacterium]